MTLQCLGLKNRVFRVGENKKRVQDRRRGLREGTWTDEHTTLRPHMSQLVPYSTALAHTMKLSRNHRKVAWTKLLLVLWTLVLLPPACSTGSEYCGGDLECSLLIIILLAEAGTCAKFSGMSERLMLRRVLRSKVRFICSPALAFSRMTSTSSNVSSSSSSCTLVDISCNTTVTAALTVPVYYDQKLCTFSWTN